MADDPHAGVCRQYALEPARGLGGSIGHDHHSRVQAHPDSHATAVVESHPARTGGGIHQRIEEREVGDGVGAVSHRLGLSMGRGDAAAIEMIATDHDGGSYLSGSNEVV